MVVADLQGHWIPGATILSVDGEILGWDHLLEKFQDPPVIFNVTESDSYGADLGGFASLQLSTTLLQT